MSKVVFELSRVSGQPVSDFELLADLRRVAQLRGADTVSARQYTEHGQFAHITISKRFGSWNKALLAAGLCLSNEVDLPDMRLFENLLTLWKHYGRQPRRSELAQPPSTISQTPYNRRFGGWTAALKAFVGYANSTEQESTVLASQGAPTSRHTTSRYPSLRLQWKVLKRNHYKCCACGRSPATTVGLELHVDHITPWSKGGETVLENLQTLCSDHNLGKSNEHEG
jgi:hypothetical protein